MKSLVNTVSGETDSTQLAGRHADDAGRRETKQTDNAVPLTEARRLIKMVATIAKK